MRLYRAIFDSSLFLAPVYYPGLLILYCSIHLFFPCLIHYPKKLDNINHKINIKIY